MLDLDKFFSFVIGEIGFSLFSDNGVMIYLKYGEEEEWVISISYPDGVSIFDEYRYSLEYYGKVLSLDKNRRNFSLDDLNILEVFRDEIRDKKLKELGI